MWCKKLSLALLVSVLAGCASPPPLAPLADNALWQDKTYRYDPALVLETQAAIFSLDPALLQSLKTADLPALSMQSRLSRLVTHLYGPGGIRMSYAGGTTTGATETWRSQRGDCMSLTILAYASAQALGIRARMQEVQIPVTIDRHDGFDVVSGHVNLFIQNRGFAVIDGREVNPGGIVLDFEPQWGSFRNGDWLTEEAVMARFYNNRGVQYLFQKDEPKAYAYFRAAVKAAPEYAATYANLAQLYISGGRLDQAESVLRYAIALRGTAYAPLRDLVQLLKSQGRDKEAQQFADVLKQRESEDPYYWVARGLAALHQQDFAAAVRYLEQAASLTTGFEEIHRNLAIAYWRNGQPEAASKQLGLLTAINSKAQGLATLSKKLQTAPPRTEFH